MESILRKIPGFRGYLEKEYRRESDHLARTWLADRVGQCKTGLAGGFKPGTYELILGVEDRVSRKIAAYRNNVAVPDLTPDALSLSSITLAATIEPIDFVYTTAKPFHLGKFRIVPRPGNKRGTSHLLNSCCAPSCQE